MEIQVGSVREETGILKSQLACFSWSRKIWKMSARKLDLFISQSSSLGTASQIHKSTHYEDSETWDEDVWDYRGENFSATSDSFPFWPLIETEVTNEGEYGSASNSLVSCKIGWIAGVFQAFGRIQDGICVTEYTWQVCLTGEDWFLWSEEEKEVYWSTGVFLTRGHDYSLTAWVVHWAGGTDQQDRGDPLFFKTTGLSDLWHLCRMKYGRFVFKTPQLLSIPQQIFLSGFLGKKSQLRLKFLWGPPKHNC